MNTQITGQKQRTRVEANTQTVLHKGHCPDGVNTQTAVNDVWVGVNTQSVKY